MERHIDVGQSLTGFAKRIIGYAPAGPHLRTFRAQLARLPQLSAKTVIND